MGRKCAISQVSKQFGHRISHAKNATKHCFLGNLQWKRVYIPEEKRFIRLRLSTRMIRTIDKLGLKGALQTYGLSLADVSPNIS